MLYKKNFSFKVNKNITINSKVDIVHLNKEKISSSRGKVSKFISDISVLKQMDYIFANVISVILIRKNIMILYVFACFIFIG